MRSFKRAVSTMKKIKQSDMMGNDCVGEFPLDCLVRKSLPKEPLLELKLPCQESLCHLKIKQKNI